MRISKITYIVSVIVLLRNVAALAQIPGKGSDFQAMAGLHWGLPIQTVYDILNSKGKVEKRKPSVLSYEDVFFDAKVEIYFAFRESNALLKLNSIEVRLNDPDDKTFKNIDKYFISRYGGEYKYKKDIGWNDKIDTEVKSWRLDDDNIELKVLIYKQKRIVAIIVKYRQASLNECNSIMVMSIKGSDFPSLSCLQWGMTMQAAIQQLKRNWEIIHSSSSKLYYEDTVLNTKAGITLRYDYTDSLVVLYAVDAEIMEPSKQLLQLLTSNMIDRYGYRYEAKKESKSQFFYTLNFEVKTWHLKNENIGLRTLSHGDDVKSINLTYTYNDTKR